MDTALGYDPFKAYDPEAVAAMEDALLLAVVEENAPPTPTPVPTPAVSSNRRGKKA